MKIIERVENILKVSHRARNDDRELLIIYMQKSGLDLSPEQIAVFRKLPSMETIRRSRQLLQEQGKYLADPEVEQKRFEKYQAMKNVKFEDPERILEQQGKVALPWGQ